MLSGGADDVSAGGGEESDGKLVANSGAGEEKGARPQS